MLKRLLVFVFSFVGIVCYCQHYPSITYTDREGLLQMQVTNVFEDSRGYIWVGTKFGISKFDGKNFENFTLKDSLKQNQVNSFIEDSKHNIWIWYAYDFGYAKFDGQKFKNFTFAPTRCSNIVEYKDEMVFSRNDSIFEIKNDNIRFKQKLPIKTSGEWSVYFTVEPQTNILYLFYGENGKGTDVFYWDESKKNFIQFHHSSINIYRPFNIRNEVLISGFVDDKAVFYSLENKKINEYFSFSSKQTSFQKYPAFNFNFNLDGKVWIYSKNDKKITQIANLSGGVITTSKYFKERNRLYIGTEKGLVCVLLNGFKYFKEEDVPYAWGVVEDSEKNKWFTNYNYPIQKFDGVNIKDFKQYYAEIAKQIKQKGNPVDEANINTWYFSPLRDKYGKLWFPRLDGALVIDKGKLKYLASKNNSFFSQTEDPKRNKIIGCGFGGISVIENSAPYRDEFITDTTAMFSNNSLVLTVAVDKKGNYWLGGNDIAKYNPDTKTFTYYTKKNNKLPKRGIANITIDSYGGIWASSFYYGLYKFNDKNDRFESIFANYFNESNTCTSYIGQINERYLVVGDNRNLNIIDLKEFYQNGKEKIVKRFNINSGFMGLEPGQNGFYKDSDGNIWITSSTVLSYFDPKKISFEQDITRTFIRNINGQRLPFDYEKNLVVELPYDTNTFRLWVESVGEDNSAEPQFSYRIRGFVDEWTQWQKGNEIFLMNLPNGKYTIEVKSQHSILDEKNQTITALNFKVSIPFWKSPNFYKYALLGFFLMVFLIVFVWRRSHTQQKGMNYQKRYLEEQKRQINLLQVQTTQAQLNPHFIFNVLTAIQGQIRVNKTSEARDNIVKLAGLIRNFLNASNFDDHTVTSILKLELTLKEEINLIRQYIEFEKMQRDNFDYEIIEVPPVDADNYKIQPMLIQPFVENAIKHGFNELKIRGKLSISFIEKDDSLICIIDDNGIGRGEAKKIQRESYAKYKSLGTELVQKRIEVLQKVGYLIELQIEDKKPSGTKVTLKISFEG